MEKKQLWYKGKYQAPGMVSVDADKVDDLLASGEYSITKEENDTNSSKRSSGSTRKTKKQIEEDNI